jgi:metallopeptidase MepB
MRALLAVAKFDMLIHGAKSVEEAKVMGLGEIYQRTRREVMGLSGLERGGGSAGWGAEHAKSEHLFQGYEAGDYSYVV